MSIVVLGGGTFSDVAPHLSLCTRAFGTTAKQLYRMIDDYYHSTRLILTKMADGNSNLITNKDVEYFIDTLILMPRVRAIIFNVAMCDFYGVVQTGKEYSRLSSASEYQMTLTPDTTKVIAKIKAARPDIFTVGFKTTHNSSPEEQIAKARHQIKTCGVDLVLANDIGNRNNILVSSKSTQSGTRLELLHKIAELTMEHAVHAART